MNSIAPLLQGIKQQSLCHEFNVAPLRQTLQAILPSLLQSHFCTNSFATLSHCLRVLSGAVLALLVAAAQSVHTCPCSLTCSLTLTPRLVHPQAQKDLLAANRQPPDLCGFQKLTRVIRSALHAPLHFCNPHADAQAALFLPAAAPSRRALAGRSGNGTVRNKNNSALNYCLCWPKAATHY